MLVLFIVCNAREKVMSQVSDGLWGIIRSSDGMKGEITETVQSVYNRLLNPKGKAKGESSTPHMMDFENGAGNSGSNLGSATEVDDELSDSEPKEPPGFSFSHNHLKKKNSEGLQLPLHKEKGPTEEQQEGQHKLPDKLESQDVGHSDEDMGCKQPCDVSDEDPDVPPGFG